MKVILLSNVAKLGKIDEIKEVSDGYARNYLFARNLAIPATNKAISDLDGKETKEKKQAAHDLLKEQTMVEKLDGYELEFVEKVSDGGSLYAAVSAEKIASALKKRGFNITKKQVSMDPIKAVGQYEVLITFSHGLEAQIILTVLAK